MANFLFLMRTYRSPPRLQGWGENSIFIILTSDETLSYNYHTNFLCNKLNRSLFSMRHAKNLLTPTALKTLYFAFIQSHLNYCPIILSGISQQNFNQIKLIQKKLFASSLALRTQHTQHHSLHSSKSYLMNSS